jgi:ribosomal-protein-alanine N-acetyltransferase
MNIEKYNEIYTKRLVLRRFIESDFENYYDILKQEEVSKWIGSGKIKSKDDVKNIMRNFESHWKKNNYGVWAVIKKENNELVGHCGLKPLEDIQEIELLYAFRPNSWGNGYATESARAVIRLALDELKLKHLIALVYPNNKRSCNVIEKLGFKYKGEQEHFGINLLYYELE